jgi:membrane-bound serine protease (ClpP class)
VVTQDGAAAPDKYQSYMRSIMRSTAEATGRDPEIAEAMVDETIEVEGVSEAGEVITFSTSEAIKYGFAEAQVNSIDKLLEHAGVDDYEITYYELSGTEKIISFFINPVVSGILIAIILGGIYFELQSPGIGFPILASVVALILYLVPYYLNGIAENWEIIAFFAGIALIGLEIFIIPGFGIAGISGIIVTLGSLVLIMINNDAFNFEFVPFEQVILAISTALGGLLAGIVVMLFGGVRLVNSDVFKRISLEDVQDKMQGYTSNFQTSSMIGKTGKTFTVLRPSGKILIDGEIYDAYTRGEYLDKNTEIKVVDESGTSLKVRKVEK